MTDSDNDARYEAVSALADGEFLQADAPALAAAVSEDPQARQRFARYHLIGDALRGNLPARLDPAFAERLRLAVADEPAVLAPRRRLQGLLKPAAGFALAASVAAMAVIGVQQINNGAVGERPAVASQEQPLVTPPVQVVRFDAAPGQARGQELDAYRLEDAWLEQPLPVSGSVDEQGRPVAPGQAPPQP